MNRILVLVIIGLFPIMLITDKKEEEVVFKPDTLENYTLEVKVDNDLELNDKKNDAQTVLVSDNKDKSMPYQLDLEEYVVGVVAGEMPASFNLEALKAQAVAARTFALYKMRQNNNYVLSTTINDQVYLTKEEMQKKWGSDYELYYNKVKEAVDATTSEVLTYNDELIISYYFAISNGYTDDAKIVFNEDRAYLVSVESSWDKNFKSYSSKRTIDKSSFCNKLKISCDNIVISNVIRSDNHYVREITINNVKFSGIQVFNKLSLKSTDFTIDSDLNNVYITTYGFGHGVGMSQYGAEGMAEAGYNYQEILNHYYKDTKIVNF